MRKIFFLLALLAILGSGSCKKDEESSDPVYCDADWVLEIEDEYDGLVTAYSAYLEDMSVENCNAYKAAFLDYIQAMEPFLECASWSATDRQEVQDAIDEAEEAMNELSCE
jgi:hypothetical protein